ncbi:MAG: DUF5723 family protein [Bacteroidota bacterium]
MKSIWFILIILFPLIGFSQEQSFILSTDTAHNETITAKAKIEVNSNGLTNEFINAYYQGDFISQDIKNRSLKRMNSINSLGYMLQTELEWNHVLKNQDNPTHLFIKIAQHTIDEMRYTDDLFRLVFYGNNDFIEKTAKFTRSGFQSLNYMQIKAGLTYNFPDKSGFHTLKVAMGLNLGQNHMKVDVNNGEFYTQTGGQHVYVGLNANIQQTDTANSSFFKFNGWGPNLDLAYQYTFKHQNSIGISIENLGYIEWNNQSFDHSIDTAIHFRGVEINDIFNIPKDIFKNELDSLKNEIVFSSNKSQYITYTPINLKLFYIQPLFKNKFLLTVEGGYTVFSYQKPYIGIQALWHISPLFFLTPMIQYGGYGDMNIGASAGFSQWKGFSLLIYSQFLNGLISPSSTGGEGIGIFLSKHFK